MFRYSVFLSFLYFYRKSNTLHWQSSSTHVSSLNPTYATFLYDSNSTGSRSNLFVSEKVVTLLDIRNISSNGSRGCSFWKPNCMPSNTTANHSSLFAFPLLLPCCCKEWKSNLQVEVVSEQITGIVFCCCLGLAHGYCISLLPRSCSCSNALLTHLETT